MIEGSLIFWLLVALVTAFLAARKNRSFIGWLIIGLIIPVISLILVLVLPEGKQLEVSQTA